MLRILQILQIRIIKIFLESSSYNECLCGAHFYFINIIISTILGFPSSLTGLCHCFTLGVTKFVSATLHKSFIKTYKNFNINPNEMITYILFLFVQIMLRLTQSNQNYIYAINFWVIIIVKFDCSPSSCVWYAHIGCYRKIELPEIRLLYTL